MTTSRCGLWRNSVGCALLLGSALGGVKAVQAATVFDKDGVQVDLYGILDVGLGYLEHSYAASDVLASTVNSYNLNSSPHSFTGVYSGGVSMSRFGVRGEADLGSGRKAFFRAEGAIDVNTGVLSNNGQAIYNNINSLRTANSASAINGQLFSRAAYAGFADPGWGSVQLGRTLNFSLDQVVEYDPVQTARLFSPLGYSGGIGGGLGATENSRLDNSIRYENKFGGVGFGAQYKFSGDKSAQSAGYGWVAMLGYASGPFSFKGTYSEATNCVAWPVQYSNVTPPGGNVQVENAKGYMLTALYRQGAATMKAGYESQTISAPSNLGLDVQDYFGIMLPKASVNATGQQFLSVYWVGGDYKFNQSFDLGIGVYDIDTYNSPEIGKAYWATAYSLLADYSFSRTFDTYLGVMVMQYSGVGLHNKAPVNAYSNNGMFGVGVRYRF